MQSQTIVDLKDPIAFEKTFKTYFSHLANFANQYVNDPDIAEEIVQEMFGNIWANTGKIKINTSVKSYLFGAVRNACLNHLKHEKVKQAHATHELLKVNHDDVDFLELDELQLQIDNAIQSLPEKCREIFVLSRFEDKKYQEIADLLGLSIKTVENQMGRALRTMREKLGQYIPIIIAIGCVFLMRENNLWG